MRWLRCQITCIQMHYWTENKIFLVAGGHQFKLLSAVSVASNWIRHVNRPVCVRVFMCACVHVVPAGQYCWEHTGSALPSVSRWQDVDRPWSESDAGSHTPLAWTQKTNTFSLHWRNKYLTVTHNGNWENASLLQSDYSNSALNWVAQQTGRSLC